METVHELEEMKENPTSSMASCSNSSSDLEVVSPIKISQGNRNASNTQVPYDHSVDEEQKPNGLGSQENPSIPIKAAPAVRRKPVKVN